MRIVILVPAYNESKVIGKVLSKLKRTLKNLDQYQCEIVVIDDGSTDDTYKKVKKQLDVTLLTHPINRGLGGALGTGLAYAKHKKSDIVVTFDADGQHDEKDLTKVITPILKGKTDVVIGSRTLNNKNKIPIDRRLIITLSNVLTKILYGIHTSDSQSGFRAFSRLAIKLIQLKTQGMEVSTEFFSEIRSHRLRLSEVPINVKYSSYSLNKGQSILNSINIFARLLLRIAR